MWVMALWGPCCDFTADGEWGVVNTSMCKEMAGSVTVRGRD